MNLPRPASRPIFLDSLFLFAVPVIHIFLHAPTKSEAV
jgi:hypothetical protein